MTDRRRVRAWCKFDEDACHALGCVTTLHPGDSQTILLVQLLGAIPILEIVSSGLKISLARDKIAL